MKNAFYFILIALFVLEIFQYLIWLFGLVGKRFDKKAKVNFTIYGDTNWITNNYNKHISQYTYCQLSQEVKYYHMLPVISKIQDLVG